MLSSQGFVAGINLQQMSALPSGYGFSINSSFLLEANTTGQQQTVGGLTIPAGNFALVHAAGDLTLRVRCARHVRLPGHHQFADNRGGCHRGDRIARHGEHQRQPDHPVGAHPGVYGSSRPRLCPRPRSPASVSPPISSSRSTRPMCLNRSADSPSIRARETSRTIRPSPSRPAPSWWRPGGQLTIVGALTLEGEFDITITPSGLDLNASATLSSFLGANLGLQATWEYSTPTRGGRGAW